MKSTCTAARRDGPKDALDKLRRGNERFVSGRLESPRRDAARRAEVCAGQSPWAAVLTCSDSRVPPEILFDAGIGDLFVVRTAGHIADRIVLESLEYAVAHLDVPLIVVVGHTRCGAVTAAVECLASPTGGGPIAESLRSCIDPCAADPVDAAARANVRETCRAIAAGCAAVRRGIATGALQVAPAYYDLASGWVDFLSA